MRGNRRNASRHRNAANSARRQIGFLDKGDATGDGPMSFHPIKVALPFFMAFAFTTAAFAAEVKVITSNALRGAYLELVPQYEKASGNKVTLVWGPAVE